MSAERLDVELVRRGLARSRRRAAELVAEGRVRVLGAPAGKASQRVKPEDDVVVEVGAADYVSRAGHKLAGALDALDALVQLPPRVAEASCLDAGASTGGFTQVLLGRGAAHVVAVDVGHGQLVPSLAADPRVEVREGLNIRDLLPGDLATPPSVVVADLSFISLTLVVPTLLAVAAPGADLLLLVKPQFEVGRGRLGPGGVVTSPERREQAVLAVARSVERGSGERSATVHAVVPSPLPGPAGNHEYFLWAVVHHGRRPDDLTANLPAAVSGAVRAGEPALVRVPVRGASGRTS